MYEFKHFGVRNLTMTGIYICKNVYRPFAYWSFIHSNVMKMNKQLSTMHRQLPVTTI